MVLGVFFFWGWDTATNLNEESKNATKTPGHAGIIAMFLLLLVFAINIIAAQMLLPEPTWNAHQSTDPLVLRPAGGRALGRLRDDHRRALLDGGHHPDHAAAGGPHHLSMARDRVCPKVFGTIQGKLQTPAVGTLILAFICMFGIVLVCNVSSINNRVLQTSSSSIGVLIAFYYGITGVTCAWAYRKVAFQSTKFFFTGILLPLHRRPRAALASGSR